MWALLATENNGLDAAVAPWANLAAVAIMVGLFCWFLTKHIPEKERRLEDRADKKDALFLDALAAERERSRHAATTGHQAAQALADNIGEMTTELRRFNDQHRVTSHG
jgi:hypothetical protein